ncbi:EutN/CcmL family microcompartment protein [Testudinibacter sp. P27/CKL/0425]
MYLAKVIGTVVSTSKDESLSGMKLLLITRLNAQLQPDNTNPEIAVDTVGAGNGEIVIVSTGSSARFAHHKDYSVIDAAIVGIVDNMEFISLV